MQRACGQLSVLNVCMRDVCTCRCKTCAVTSSSAVCVSCFKAGGHEQHDYIMYRCDLAVLTLPFKIRRQA
jgi:hypothetical protein